AVRSGSQLLISSGAIAGLDALAAASRRTLDSLCHRIIKPPANWHFRGTAPESAAVIFRGTAREAARAYPLNANVTVATAAPGGVGGARAVVGLVSDGGAA